MPAAIGAGQTAVFAVWGTNGNCAIPSNATGIATNVTAVGPTANSYLTVFPADANPRPTASNPNVTSTSPPTPNQVTVALSAAGAIAIYNNGGNVNVIVDIVGYYIPASGGGQGPIGPQGPAGPSGVTPQNVIWVAKSGGQFTPVRAAMNSITDASPTNPYVIKVAPGVYTEPAVTVMKSDVDLEGSGRTAPPSRARAAETHREGCRRSMSATSAAQSATSPSPTQARVPEPRSFQSPWKW